MATHASAILRGNVQTAFDTASPRSYQAELTAAAAGVPQLGTAGPDLQSRHYTCPQGLGPNQIITLRIR